MRTIRRIYSLEKEVNQQAVGVDAESSPLLNAQRDDPDKVFMQALDRELERIESFYELKEPEVFGEVDELLKDDEAFRTDRDGMDVDMEAPSRRRAPSGAGVDRRASIFRDWGLPRRRRQSVTSPVLEPIESGESDDEIPDPKILRKSTSGSSSKDRPPVENRRASADLNGLRRKISATFEESSDHALSVAYSQGATLKKRMVGLYVSLCELRSFVQLNKTGFSKVLKKYDKTLDRNLRSMYIAESVEGQYAFRPETMNHINDRITQVEQAYATMNTAGNIDQARRELRLDLREHVVWERNTVWREMIGIERKAQAANLGIRQTMLGGDNERLQGDEEQKSNTKEVSTPVGRYRCPTFLLHSTFYTLILILAIFIVLIMVPIMELPEQQNCLALVAFVSLLWATEVGVEKQHSVCLKLTL